MAEQVELFVVQVEHGKGDWRTIQSPYETDYRREIFDDVSDAERVVDWHRGRARIVRILGEVVPRG